MFWLISHSIRVGILLADHFGMFWENLATNNCVTWDSRIFQMFTPRGIVIEVREEHQENAQFPILVKP